MTRIELRSIVKQYDTQDQVTLTGYRNPPALNDVSLVIHHGEVLSVVGPSGCGKSTLLKIIAGLEYPNSGQVFYNDQEFTEIKPQDRGVGFVFQDYALYPTRKGKGNLSYFFEVHSRTEEEENARIQATAELMGVEFEWLLGQMPDTLSGGQKQRVAIARCIVRDPNIFLMDEPIVNLDAKLRERTRIEMKKLLRRFEVTTVYVTHDQQEAIFMGDRIAVMRQGRIEQVGTFDDLYYTPANLFVASFIGTPPITIIPAVAHSNTVTVGSATWTLPSMLRGVIADGPLRLGVRPEAWSVDSEDGIALALRHVERIPTERAAYLIGGLPGADTVTVVVALDYQPGQDVCITPNWEQVLFFEPEGESVLHAPGVPDLF
jgi:ABC-type sugar transport system ATPase subunit